MHEQPADRRRCACCERWSGPRTAGADGDSVLVESETTTGTCGGGPWDGNERRARSACGQWLRWQALPPPAATE